MKRNHLLRLVAVSALLFAAALRAPLFAQEHTPDSHTLLLLHFNGNLEGAQGEAPTQAQSVAFEAGIFGNGAYFAPGNQVYFPSAGNLISTEGTLEFWIKPRWNGNDGGGYVMLRFGVGGRMYFAKDGANNWKITLNRFSINNPEVGVAFNLSAWQANQWHHAAFTWRSDSLKLYLDGQLLRESRVTVPLTVVNEATFQLGADFSSHYLDAVIDELRISDIARADKEIQAGFLAGLTISSLSIQPDPLRLVELQQQTLELTAQTNLGKKAIPAWAAKWSSANPAIATVDENGRVTGIAAGKTTITASYKGVSVSATVVVIALTPNDLEVMYIERNPKYPRYIAVYQDPTIFTDDWVPYRVSVPKGLGGGQTSATQRWPNIGETVTFIAHVVNHGATAQSGFSYEWYFDGQSVGSGASTKVVAPYDTAQVAWNWTWDGNRHKVKFVIQKADDRPTNNVLEDFTDALALYNFIERGHDAKFAAETPNFPNAITSSEIEWFQLHFRKMNQMFEAAGSLARVRFDKLELIPDGAPIFNGDKNAWLLYDGSFPGVLHAGEGTYRASGYYDHTEDIDYGFLHELGHQLGLIDLYRINVETSHNQVTGASRATIRCLMNSVDHFFSEHSALAMNSWHGFRRGYFGTYLYEVPQQNDLRILAADGKPLAGATVAIYQKITTPSGQETIPNQPKFIGTTDANGIYRLPNVNINIVGFVKTETGNIPRPNPFGYISLLGDNGVFLIKIEKEGFCDYQWIDITRFNIAYWQGNTIAATYDIPTNVSTDFELSLPLDLAESSASGWSAASSDAASNVVTFDANRKLFGQNSLKLETTSGFDVWLRYPKNKFARWDLTQKDSLRVWFYAENPSPFGFQNNSPWIRLYNGKCDGGYVEYHATSEVLNGARNRWKYFAIPLSGNAAWQRTDVGNVSLREINYLEIHADTWDYGFTLWVDGVSFDPVITSVDEKVTTGLPQAFALLQNYPNPFNPETEIRFALPQASHVVVKIFNLLGAEIRTLVNEEREAGYHRVHWDGKDKNGNPVASGIYLYQLRAGGFTQVKKMSLPR